MLDSFAVWLIGTNLSLFVRGHTGRPAREMLHFIGLTLLIGMVGVLTCGSRLCIRPAAQGGAQTARWTLQRRVWMKLLFIAVAGINVLLFNRTVLSRTLASWGARRRRWRK